MGVDQRFPHIGERFHCQLLAMIVRMLDLGPRLTELHYGLIIDQGGDREQVADSDAEEALGIDSEFYFEAIAARLAGGIEFGNRSRAVSVV